MSRVSRDECRNAGRSVCIAPQVVDALSVPVIAAGEIADAKGRSCLCTWSIWRASGHSILAPSRGKRFGSLSSGAPWCGWYEHGDHQPPQRPARQRYFEPVSGRSWICLRRSPRHSHTQLRWSPPCAARQRRMGLWITCSSGLVRPHTSGTPSQQTNLPRSSLPRHSSALNQIEPGQNVGSVLRSI